VHTGQNYDFELNQVFFDELGIRAPDHFLSAAGETPAATIGRVIMAADEVLAREKPEAVLILGDTNSSLAAISAKRRKIPIFHMEAGNRCFDMRVPEEINRRIVDHVADINLTYSQIAREYLLREGLPPDRVIVTGSPMREVLDFYRERIGASDALERLGLRQREYFLVSAHREENVDDPVRLNALLGVLESLAADYALPVIVSTHPRTRARLEAIGAARSDAVRFLKPFGFPDYVRLQSDARAVLSDSGTITEESSILNFPALNLREVHERPEGVEEAAVMMVGLDYARIRDALPVLDDQPRGEQRLLRPVNDYLPDNVSEKIVRIILGYTDYVNRQVWRRPN
jgi:UDP-N-acetylglucosamine 2-epimerase (non-hydrolysing)